MDAIAQAGAHRRALPDVEPVFGIGPVRSQAHQGAWHSHRDCHRYWRGSSYSMLRTMDEAYKIQQLRGHRLPPIESFWQATRGNAEALGSSTGSARCILEATPTSSR
jgi:hypothetical protein